MSHRNRDGSRQYSVTYEGKGHSSSKGATARSSSKSFRHPPDTVDLIGSLIGLDTYGFRSLGKKSKPKPHIKSRPKALRRAPSSEMRFTVAKNPASPVSSSVSEASTQLSSPATSSASSSNASSSSLSPRILRIFSRGSRKASPPRRTVSKSRSHRKLRNMHIEEIKEEQDPEWDEEADPIPRPPQPRYHQHSRVPPVPFQNAPPRPYHMQQPRMPPVPMAGVYSAPPSGQYHPATQGMVPPMYTMQPPPPPLPAQIPVQMPMHLPMQPGRAPMPNPPGQEPMRVQGFPPDMGIPDAPVMATTEQTPSGRSSRNARDHSPRRSSRQSRKSEKRSSSLLRPSLEGMRGKHFCYGCGRVRSQKFQDANPIKKGKGPVRNYCRKCRAEYQREEASRMDAELRARVEV